MLPKLNLNKFKEQKWLYFFVGSLFTALIAGGLVYFDVYGVLGRSTLRSDPTFDKPALEADSWAKIYGGIIANSTGSATSGLIVLGGVRSYPPYPHYGRVGIGFGDNEVPEEMLVVKGNVKVVDRPDTPEAEAIVTPGLSSNDIAAQRVRAFESVAVDGELRVDGQRGQATSTIDTALLVRTADGAYVDLGDVFELSVAGSKVWKDGSTPFNWNADVVYDNNRNDITSACQGTSSTAETGYQVFGGDWYEMSCVGYPYPAPPGGCIAYNNQESGWTKLAMQGFDWLHNLVAPPALAVEQCYDFVWEKSPSPITSAWSEEVQLKIKPQYLPN